MSHGPPPPPPTGSFHGFVPFSHFSDAQNPQFAGRGHDAFELMALFDDGDTMMGFEATTGASGMSMADFSMGGGHGDMSMSGHGDMSMSGHGDMSMSGHGDMSMSGHGDMPMSGHGDMSMSGHGDMPLSSGNCDVSMGNGSGDITMDNSPDAQDPSSARSQDTPMAHSVDNFPASLRSTPSAQISLSSNGNGNGSTSTLTDFTKRRNWPAKVVEELKDFLHILDANGRIKYASSSILNISGYSAEEIHDVFLKDLIHPDDQGVFVSELHESISSGNPLRLFYRFKAKNGSYAIFETIGHAHIAAARFAPNPSNQSPFCQAVFVMSRPYPTKNAGLLDSFLEHKMENERLKRRIAELRREEEVETEESSRLWTQSQEGRSDMTPSETTGPASMTGPFFLRSNSSHDDTQDMMNPALTRENLEGVVAARRSDSLGDKMARYEANLHADTIEMLTGLRYMEGERSRGITTGGSSPTLIKGDAGIAIPADREMRAGDKKKKLKTAEEYVCTDCGTLDSPEWRKGPRGPKTLCNACGLRWAKKEKKRTSVSHKSSRMDQSLG